MGTVDTRVSMRGLQQAVQPINTVWQHWSSHFEAVTMLHATTTLLLSYCTLLHLNTQTHHITITASAVREIMKDIMCYKKLNC